MSDRKNRPSPLSYDVRRTTAGLHLSPLAAPTGVDDLYSPDHRTLPVPQVATPDSTTQGADKENSGTPRTLADIRARDEQQKEAARVARNGPRPIPQYDRAPKPSVPARDRIHKKTVAFGGTVNVSQTVERKKDPSLLSPMDRLGIGSGGGGLGAMRNTRTPPTISPAGAAAAAMTPTAALARASPVAATTTTATTATPTTPSTPALAGVLGGYHPMGRDVHAGLLHNEMIYRLGSPLATTTTQRPVVMTMSQMQIELEAAKAQSARAEQAVQKLTAELEVQRRETEAIKAQCALQRDEFDRLVVLFKECVPPVPASTILVAPPRRGPNTPNAGLKDLENRNARGARSPRRDERRGGGRREGGGGRERGEERERAGRDDGGGHHHRRRERGDKDRDAHHVKYDDRRLTPSPVYRARRRRSEERENSVAIRYGSPRRDGGARRITTPSRRRVTERVTMERVHHYDDDSDESSNEMPARGEYDDHDTAVYTRGRDQRGRVRQYYSSESEVEERPDLVSGFPSDSAPRRDMNYRKPKGATHRLWDEDDDEGGPVVTEYHSDDERAVRAARIEEIREQQNRRLDGRR